MSTPVRASLIAGPLGMIIATAVAMALAMGLALGIVARTAGLAALGWLCGAGYAVISCCALAWGMRRHGRTALGPADWVTLARAALVACVAALTAGSFSGAAPGGPLVVLACAALALDWVDGQVARRTATASSLGAAFDMQVDASLILVLSVYTAGQVGVWVLAIGLMRYAYAGAGLVLPWLRRPLPPRYWRKVVAVTQGVVLILAAARWLPAPVIATALVCALALLVESFGRDVVWLWRRRADPATAGSIST